MGQNGGGGGELMGQNWGGGGRERELIRTSELGGS